MLFFLPCINQYVYNRAVGIGWTKFFQLKSCKLFHTCSPNYEPYYASKTIHPIQEAFLIETKLSMLHFFAQWIYDGDNSRGRFDIEVQREICYLSFVLPVLLLQLILSRKSFLILVFVSRPFGCTKFIRHETYLWSCKNVSYSCKLTACLSPFFL